MSSVADVHYTFNILRGFLGPLSPVNLRVTRKPGAAAEESVHIHWAETDAAQTDADAAFGRGAAEGKITLRLRAQ